MTEVHVPVQASDEVLLAQYVRERDQAAFAELVRRHAPLVWSVSRRIVGQHHSAEDAFQATFVVLMQQAPRLTLRAKLGTWLYAVAVKVARRTQARDARHTTDQFPAASSKPVEQLTVQELIAIVREEVGRLPRRYQPVMELCYLQQLSISDVAERLGLTTGTIRGMLQRGRKLLEARLLQRGIAPLALASISLTTLLAEPLPSATLYATQAMALGRVPEQLTRLTQVSTWTWQSGLAGIAVVLLALSGLGWSLLDLRAAPPSPTPFPRIGLLNPSKSLAEVCGYVDDHEGKPLVGVTVEVIKGGRVETTLKTDGVGRFQIPEPWKTDHDRGRFLLVRIPGGLGWSQQLQMGKPPLQHDIMIKVLPLTSKVQATLTSGKATPKLLQCTGWFQHPGNGMLHSLYMPPELNLMQGVMKGNELTTLVPQETTGTLIVNCDGLIEQRINITARGPGQCHVGDVKLQQGGTITGTVVDAEGKPMAGAQLIAQSQNADESRIFVLHGHGAQSYSDANGKYVLSGLEPRFKFNVALGSPMLRPGSTVPQVLVAKEAVAVKVGELTQLPLQLQPARQVKGIMKEKHTGKPIAQTQVGYYGTARPRTSAMIMGENTNAAGEFSFWVPPGAAFFYCCDGISEGSVDVTIPEQGETPFVNITASKRPVMHSLGMVAHTVGTVEHTDDPKQQVQAYALVQMHDSNHRPSGTSSYQYQFTFKNEHPLPSVLRYRLYRRQDLVPESELFMRMQGSLAISDKSISMYLPEAKEEITLELDAEGYQPLRWSERPKMQSTAIELELIPAKYFPLTCRIKDAPGNAASQARVQIELKRHGASFESPWGPILTTDAQGQARFDHLRQGDVFRLRVYGIGSERYLSDWITIGDAAQQVDVRFK